MNPSDTIRQLKAEQATRQLFAEWLETNRSKLEATHKSVWCSNYCGQTNATVTFFVEKREHGLGALLSLLSGVWNRKVDTDGAVRYNRGAELGVVDSPWIDDVKETATIDIHIVVAELPPSCKVEEVEVQEPEMYIPARTVKVKKVTCLDVELEPAQEEL